VRRINAAVHVGNEFDGQVIDAGKVRPWPVNQMRKFPAVAPWQMPARGPNLVFDQIKIVQQPFCGGSDAPGALDAKRFLVVGPQKFFIRCQPRQEAICPPAQADFMPFSEVPGVLLKQFNAQKFASEGRFVAG